MTDRKAIRRAWRAHILDMYDRPNALLTMNFNRSLGYVRMLDYAKAFFARTDRHYIGRSYYKKTVGRMDFLGVIESPSTNPHIHWYGHFPHEIPGLSDSLSLRLTMIFKTVVPSGTIDCRWVWNKKRLAGYITKQTYLPERSDRIVYSRDFWPSAITEMVDKDAN